MSLLNKLLKKIQLYPIYNKKNITSACNNIKHIIIIMPVYNEQSIIESVLHSWVIKLDSMQLNYEIHAYNDGSKDRTAEILEICAAKYSQKIIVHNKQNSGHGPTILQGYIENADNTEWLFQVDSDNEMSPDFFDKLWNKRMDYDFLTGKRDGRQQPLARKIISFFSRLCVRLFYGKSIWDVNTPYRLMRAEVFKEIFQLLPRNTFAPNVILTGMACRENLRCFEMPIPQQERRTGEVSIKKWKLFRAAVRSFRQTISFAFLSQMNWVWWLSFFICMIAVFAAICSFAHGVDSSVFVHVAQVMYEGGMPYIDVMDHKGPLLYWINYFSFFVGKYGVLIPQYIMWIIVFFAAWRWLKKIYSAETSCVSVCMCAVCIVWFNEGGNFTETYAFFLSLFPMLYLYDDAMGKNNFSLIKCFITGICTGGILMLRPNILAMPITTAFYLTAQALQNRDVKLFGKQIICGLSGLFTAIIPFVLWLYNKDALYACYTSYILFNIEYLNTHLTFPDLQSKIVFLFTQSRPFIVAVFFFILSNFSFFVEKIQYRKKMLFLNNIYFLISLLIFYTKPHYKHYYLTMFIAIFPLIATYTELCFSKIKKSNFIYPLVLMLFCCFIIFPQVLKNFKYGFPQPNAEMRLFASYIGENYVSIRNDKCSIYRLQGNFKTKSRYILYQHKENSVWNAGITHEELFPVDSFLILTKNEKIPQAANGFWELIIEGEQNSLYKFISDTHKFQQ